MNVLLKLTSEMVSNINNTSNFTSVQNSTWKNPIKEQEDQLEQIHQQLLKAQKWGNELTQENSTELITSSNQPKKRNKRNIFEDFLEGMSKVTFNNDHGASVAIQQKYLDNINEFPQKETNYINSLNPIIKFAYDNGDAKLVLWLDTSSKRIKFYRRKNYSGKEYNFKTYANIIIRDENRDIIDYMTFNPNELVSDVLRVAGFLEESYGTKYKDGYTITITSSPADATWIKRNDNHDWMANSSKGQHTEELTIINNWLWHNDYYQKKYFSLLEDWNYKVQHGRTDSYEWILQHTFDYKHVMQTIHNTIAIDNLKTEISNIYNKIAELENEIRALKNKSINGFSACSSTIGGVKTLKSAVEIGKKLEFSKKVFNYIPVYGQSIGLVLDLASSACSLAGAYGRKRRDVSVVENKFNDSFIKSINQEQHLPKINNQTNFVEKNATSL